MPRRPWGGTREGAGRGGIKSWWLLDTADGRTAVVSVAS